LILRNPEIAPQGNREDTRRAFHKVFARTLSMNNYLIAKIKKQSQDCNYAMQDGTVSTEGFTPRSCANFVRQIFTNDRIQ